MEGEAAKKERGAQIEEEERNISERRGSYLNNSFKLHLRRLWLEGGS